MALALPIWAGELPFAQPRPQLYTAGQPSAAQLQQAAEAGVTTVIDLRQPDEDRGFDETAAAERLGLRYVRIPVAGAAGLTQANARALRATLAQSTGPVLLHCASGNRAGALLAVLQAQDGASVEQALELGRRAGMTSLEAPTRVLLEQDAAR
ncbi:sulfur transferase domain-containing protein [Stenotrophomonas sp.]|uniref:beta-lactamase hydrolase domain-containing protein n=1 Tax=Stenotrophomonas sp. TaxID=69392 RepID=UPI002898C6E1|nr:sulfur transferase domain-containing protein [Stenotrophomonas sp.]